MAQQRRRIAPRQRLAIKERASFQCEYCCSPEAYSPDIFEIEHIISLFAGGSNDVDNLALACGLCNENKHKHTAWNDPLTQRLTPLFHPRKEEWTVHFSWNEDFTLIIRLTPKGRATIDLLKMNRPALVNLRIALLAVNAHPGKPKWK
jgi:5-methylcytosine-specific restriction endonuclease McrA